MSLSFLRWTTLIAMLCTCACGCSYFRGSSSDEDDIDLTEIEEVEKPEEGEFSRISIAQSSATNDAMIQALKVGDRFPFSKSVEHRLSQVDKLSNQQSTSRTDMILTLVVDTVTPDNRKLMTVQFQRVQYVHDILGKQVMYSSDETKDVIPPEALLYAGLANNGFSFWLDANNSVTDVVGYSDFLHRCLRNVPDQHKVTIQQQLESMNSVEGVSNFLDESVGLLSMSSNPARPGLAVRKGESWEMEPRYCRAPIPLVTDTRCILKELTTDSADVLITGRISGSPDPVTLRDGSGEIKVIVNGGNFTGSCRINPQTGIPIKSQIQRSLDLVMELPDGHRIRQTKDTVTTFTIMSEPTQDPGSNTDDRQFQQTNFQNGIGVETSRRIVPSGFTPH